jgi:hypothetical protein
MSYGRKEARSTVKAIIGNVLDDLETEGNGMSAKNQRHL